MDQRARIVEAAIDCIQRDGIQAVTSRSIAKAAGVNVAALNYYFGGKDRVLEIAIERARRSAFVDTLDDLERLLEKHRDMREAMAALLDEVIEGATKFPRVGLAIVHETVSEQRYDTAFVVVLEEFLDRMFARIGSVLRGTTEKSRRTSLAQLWSTVMFLGLLPRAFERSHGYNLRDPKSRRVFVRELMDAHFAPVSAKRKP